MEKKRSANFSLREKDTLISLVEKYFHILENKKTNAVFNKQKAECWEVVANEFNASQITGLRTGPQLRATYEKLKQMAKKHKAEDRVQMLKTGGGIFTPSSSMLDEKILSLLKDKFFCVDNRNDSNNTLQNMVNEVGPSHPPEEENILVYSTDDITEYPSTSVPIIDVNLDQHEQEFQNLPWERRNEATVINVEATNIETLDSTPRMPGKKRKRELRFKTPEITKNILADKKIEVFQKKLDVLNVMEKVEEENLKTASLGYEIMKVRLEKEQIELEMLKKQNKDMHN